MHVVTGLTLRAQRTLVTFFIVILAVTSDAVRWRLIAIERSGMAADASSFEMFAQKRILRVSVVVEREVSPVLGGMAGFALLAELAFVALLLVVKLVTAIALYRQFLTNPADRGRHA